MPFEKGKSGNAKGRPPKNRTLTAILERAGSEKRKVKGLDGTEQDVVSKRLVADLLWQAAATGSVLFPDGTQRVLHAQDWVGVIKFIYAQIDGPPKAELDITSGGESLLIKMDR